MKVVAGMDVGKASLDGSVSAGPGRRFENPPRAVRFPDAAPAGQGDGSGGATGPAAPVQAVGSTAGAGECLWARSCRFIESGVFRFIIILLLSPWEDEL